MADYYSILNKTITGLPQNTAETRAMVYAKARTAIDKQLRSRDPAPSEEIINRQMEMLEEAIEKVEADASIDQAISELNVPDKEMLGITEVDDDKLMADTSGDAPSSVSMIPPDKPVEADVGEPQQPAKDVSDPAAGLPPLKDEPVATASVRQPEPPGVQAPARRNPLMRMLPYLLGLIIVAGGAYALWLNKDALIASFSGAGTETSEPSASKEPDQTDANKEVRVVEPVEPEQPDDGGSEDTVDQPKDNVRLTEDGDSVVATPTVPEPVTEPVKEGETPIILNEDVAADTPPTTDDKVEVSEVTGNENAADSESTNNTATETPAVGQSAFLYEEGDAGAGAARNEAVIVWSLVQEPPSEGLPPEAVIKGKLTVPDRGLTMDLVLKRNTDEGLPASHIIELLFDAPNDFSGGQIDNIARFVLKATEQARGDGLVAVPAKISNGYFLIALNNLPQAIETNSKLLVESDWIDIPMGYTTGRRALVTLEKGAVGDKVFRDAFEDWKNR